MATCFHHHDRETGRACTRCGRPACPDCLTQAAGGIAVLRVHPSRRPEATTRIRQTLRRDPLIATKFIIAVNVVAFAAIALRDQTISGNGPTSFDLGLFGPAVHNGDWWRLVSYSVVHIGLLHIGSNLFMLFIVGRVFEPGVGPTRFLTLYVVSVLSGAAGALIATPHALTGGASGGIFGVAAAATLVMSRRGIRFMDTGFGPLLVLNLVLGLFESSISIGGHIGGLIGGALSAELMMQARKPRCRYSVTRARRSSASRRSVSRSRCPADNGGVATPDAAQPPHRGESDHGNRDYATGTSSTAPVSSSSTRRKPHCSASAARPSRGPLASTSSPASSVIRAARPVEVAAAAPDREQVETGVVAELGPTDRLAVEQAAGRDRVLHHHVVGLAERDREHRVHLLVLLDQPHELLGRVADLLRRGTEVQQPRSPDGSTVSAAARSTHSSSCSRISSRRSSSWLTCAARPGVAEQQRRVREADRRLGEVLHVDQHVDGAVEVGDRRVFLDGRRAPLRRAGELAHLGDALARAAQDQDVVGEHQVFAVGIEQPLAAAPQRDDAHPDVHRQLDIGERCDRRAPNRRESARGATPLRPPRDRRRARAGFRDGASRCATRRRPRCPCARWPTPRAARSTSARRRASSAPRARRPRASRG